MAGTWGVQPLDVLEGKEAPIDPLKFASPQNRPTCLNWGESVVQGKVLIALPRLGLEAEQDPNCWDWLLQMCKIWAMRGLYCLTTP